MRRIREHADYLSLMHKHGKNPGERKKLINLANKGEVEACCELYLNAIKGNFDVTPALAKSLERHKKNCAHLLNHKVPIAKKKRILAGQTGGFLPLIAGALLPLVGSLAKGVVGGIASAISNRRRR